MLALFLVWMAVVSVDPAYALRCARSLVSEGDHKIKVRHKCGEPVSIETYTGYKTLYVPHRPHHVLHHPHVVWHEITVSIAIEEWLYNFGPHRFMRLLRFENGKLAEIDALHYGY